MPIRKPKKWLWTKDKVEKQKKAAVVYKILCSQGKKVHIGETGRQLGTRITEHRKEVEKISDKNFTRSTRRASTNEHHKLAITDHICQNNHIMNWEASEIVEQESNKFKRWTKESYVLDRTIPLWRGTREPISFLPYGHKTISDLHPQTRGEGGIYKVTLSVYRNNFKTSDTFNVF